MENIITIDPCTWQKALKKKTQKWECAGKKWNVIMPFYFGMSTKMDKDTKTNGDHGKSKLLHVPENQHGCGCSSARLFL